jgi:transposase
MTVKTDRKDARGIAHLMRMGWFRPAPAKSAGSQEVRALLTARKLLQDKLKDVELSVRGILRGFGLKVGKVRTKTFETRIRQLVSGQPTLEQIAEAVLSARASLQRQFNMLHKAILKVVRKDKVCRQLPVATMRHSTIRSLRANATIIVLRIELRPSAARFLYHCANSLFGWNLRKRHANWIMV